MITQEMCPIRAEILTHKHLENIFICYLYDKPLMVSDKITSESISCLILEILGKHVIFSLYNPQNNEIIL